MRRAFRFCGFAAAFSASRRRLKHPTILAEIDNSAQKIFAGGASLWLAVNESQAGRLRHFC
jgi:hypothetical protein